MTSALRCAICCGTAAPFTREPLGRNDAPVDVCADCSTPAREKRGPERSYEGAGPSLSSGELTAAMRNVMGDATYERETARAVAYGIAPAHALSAEERDMGAFHQETDRLIRARAVEHNNVRSYRTIGPGVTHEMPEDVDGEAAYIERHKEQA